MRINGIELKPFTDKQRRVLIALGLAYPKSLNSPQLIGYVYPDPDLEPEYPESNIRNIVNNLRRKGRIPNWRVVSAIPGSQAGYRLERLS
jgi:hypothetical protein